MIAILAIFSQLAFLHVQCAPRSNEESDIDIWWLKEVFIKSELTQEPTEHYPGKSRLTRYNDGFCLDTLKEGSHKERKVIACFKVNELYAFLDDELYAMTRDPQRTIRMTIRSKKTETINPIELFQPSPFRQTFEVLKRYYITSIIISDGLAKLTCDEDEEENFTPITLTVYVGLDELHNETEDRRFIISGGDYDALFAVFNRDELHFVWKSSNDRVVLEVHPPGNFWGKLFYSMKMSLSQGGTLDEFIDEMSCHTSAHAGTSPASTILAPYL